MIFDVVYGSVVVICYVKGCDLGLCDWCCVVFLLCLYSGAGRLTVLVTVCELCCEICEICGLFVFAGFRCVFASSSCCANGLYL